jgi:hypothetical protein
MTRDDVRRLAMAQPQAYEAEHHGMPSFRVGQKIFCTIHLDHPRAMLKLDPEDQKNLAEDDPAAIEPVPGYWGRNGSTFVWYERLGEDRLAALMRMAWAGVAPKRLVKARAAGA